MAGQEGNSKIAALLMVFGLFLLSASLAYPTEEVLGEDTESLAYQLSNANKLEQEAAHFNQNDKPKSCFHFYVSRNMSSLLSDATKMLQQVRDRREREWILTFIYRIKSLGEHLRTHPEARNYDCLPVEEEDRKMNPLQNDPLKSSQQELYFVDESWPNSMQKRTVDTQKVAGADKSPLKTQSNEMKSETADNQRSHPFPTGAWHEESMSDATFEKKAEPEEPSVIEPVSNDGEIPDTIDDSIPTDASATHPELNEEVNEEAHQENRSPPPNADKTESDTSEEPSYGPKGNENDFVFSVAPNCGLTIDCDKAMKKLIEKYRKNGMKFKDDGLIQHLTYSMVEEEERKEQEEMKIKKLRSVGGTLRELINLWEQNAPEPEKSTNTHQEGDFDYEENGAAAGDLNSNDHFTTNDHTVAPSLGEMKKRQTSGSGTKAYEPYDDNDVLVKQLFDVRFENASPKTDSLMMRKSSQ
ncbi:uncharacterized protein TNCT_331011 [Trichonephila clavata]|uniref:Uncharacterized protein n=1 Tax=Trichonephila clavata TaxID=2740835 RepID=A0A8X6IG73_TRICU|nr:uncharacterized protein TNCT_331011 [Trichonephila clavata]